MRRLLLTTVTAALCLPTLAFGQAAPPQCPMVLDFDWDAQGNPIVAGQDVSSAYSSWGIDIIAWTAMSMSSSDIGDPIAFNSAAPTGGDWDLGTPSNIYGGPGIGSGGASNDQPLGNLLISAENDIDANGDGLIDDPDDDAGGAWFEFLFDQPTCIFSLTIIDSDGNETPPDLVVYDAAGSQLEWINYSVTGNNGVEVQNFSICGVDHIMVDVYSSGALDNLVVCNGGSPEVCDGVDNDGDGDIDEGGWTVESAVPDASVSSIINQVSLWLPGVGNFEFVPGGTFTEDEAAGTATITGTMQMIGDPTALLEVSGLFTGRTTVAGAGSPKLQLFSSQYVANGGTIDPSDWYYYGYHSGTFTGAGSLAGAELTYTETGPNMQIGYGANGKNLNYGGSTWLNVSVTSQPASGPSLNPTGAGDFNWDFFAGCGVVDVCDGIDNDGDGIVDEDGNGAAGAVADPTVYPGAGGGSLDRALWLSGIGDFAFNPGGTFEENPVAGTATLTGTLEKQGDPSKGFEVSFSFGSRNASPGPGSPFLELMASAYVSGGGSVDPSTWYYYDTFTGSLTGTGGYAGAAIDLTQAGPSFQVGEGASGRNAALGASSWVNVVVTSQPTTGPALSPNGNGDLNIDLAPCFSSEVCDGVDNDGDGLVDEGFDVDGDGVTTCGGDCDDSDGSNTPGNTEVCDGDDENCDGAIDEGFDADNDGFTVCDGDCDDTNAAVNPGATEVCDSIDNDCDGLVDEGFDVDGDGVTVCGGDCDDADADNYPGNIEICDGDNEDCDGLVDEGFDADNDGFTVCNGDCDDTNPNTNPACPDVCNGVDDDCDGSIDEDFDLDGDGYTTCNGDCDDTNAAVNPGATEVCDGIDNDCDGLVDENSDNDGDGVTSCGGDCDDNDASNYPGNAEVCDGDDEDCDGVIDNGFDVDGDGVSTCGGDCDDTDFDVNPGATEVCDGDDEDCDGLIDEGYDVDGDGVTTCDGDCDDNDASNTPGNTEVCDGDDENCDGVTDEGFDVDGDGVSVCDGDCDDNDASNTPGNTEVCDGDDENCDGLIDEGFDVDGDGYTVCDGDCDDTNFDVNPGASEICNGIDDNCDGFLLDGEEDDDGDGVRVCDGDCDDDDATAYPGATEICDGADNDCDGDIDEGFDADGDGYATCDGDCDDTNFDVNPGATEICDGVDNDCDGMLDATSDDDADGYSICDGDCDDTDPAINPGASEVCNGIDDNCDGFMLDGEEDDDGDGVSVCEGDCDDLDPNTYPGATEVCDGVDNDCDGVIPTDEYDWDGDGMPACDGDCNDGDPTIYDGAPEFCDNIDTDCDGAADNGYDNDGDGIPDCIDQCPQIVDNDSDPWGEILATGDDMTTAYQNWGITIERYEDGGLNVALPSITWDADSPNPGEEDFGTPNADFGGPGIGVDGGIGSPGVNEYALHNVQKGTDGNTWWVVNFSSSTCVHSIKFLDVDANEIPAQVILFDVNVQTINTFTSSGLGNNSVEELDLGGTCGVFVMMIDGYASMAWDELHVCVDPDGGPEVCGDFIDNDGDGETDEDCVGNGPDIPVTNPNGDDTVGEFAGPDANDGAGCSQSGDTDPRLGFLLLMGLAMGIRRRKPLMN